MSGVVFKEANKVHNKIEETIVCCWNSLFIALRLCYVCKW